MIYQSAKPVPTLISMAGWKEEQQRGKGKGKKAKKKDNKKEVGTERDGKRERERRERERERDEKRERERDRWKEDNPDTFFLSLTLLDQLLFIDLICAIIFFFPSLIACHRSLGIVFYYGIPQKKVLATRIYNVEKHNIVDVHSDWIWGGRQKLEHEGGIFIGLWRDNSIMTRPAKSK
jgi:hypothetical protein